MRLLVTGASGFTGSALVRAALRSEPGMFVAGLGPRDPANGASGALPWEIGSASDSACVARAISLHRINAVAHLARSERQGSDAEVMRSHVSGALGVLAGAQKAGGVERALILGSAAEYGLLAEKDLPIGEDHPLSPNSTYGLAKVAETSLARLAPGSLGVPAVVGRLFNPVGPGQGASFVCGSLASQFAAMKRAGAPSPLQLGALTPMRDFIDVEDAAEALLELLRSGVPGECYNIGTGRGTRVSEVVAMFREISGMDATVAGPAAAAPAPDSPEHSVADVSKIRSLTGWAARKPLRESLREIFERALRG